MQEIKKVFGPLVASALVIAAQWIHTNEFTFDQEFVTLLYGVVAAVVVKVTRNVSFDPARKAISTVALALAAMLVQYLTTGNVSDTEEFATAVTGLLAVVFTYYLKNTGANINKYGSEDKHLGTTHAPAGSVAP